MELTGTCKKNIKEKIVESDYLYKLNAICNNDGIFITIRQIKLNKIKIKTILYFYNKKYNIKISSHMINSVKLIESYFPEVKVEIFTLIDQIELAKQLLIEKINEQLQIYETKIHVVITKSKKTKTIWQSNLNFY